MRIALLTSATLAATLAVAACGDNSSSGGDAATPAVTATAGSPSATQPAATTAGATITSTARSTTTTPVSTATTAATATASAKRVSANNSARAELQAAFEAAGIPNASAWAREVEEYRPYPESDPTFAKLRQNLAKYNPAAGVVDQIIAVLSLP